MWVVCANFRHENPAWSTGVSLSHTRSRGPKVVCRFSSRKICARHQGYGARSSLRVVRPRGQVLDAEFAEHRRSGLRQGRAW
jgi:hypothetical protein